MLRHHATRMVQNNWNRTAVALSAKWTIEYYQKVDGVGTKWGEVSIKKNLEKNGFEWINVEYSWNVDPSLVLLPGWKTEASATPFQPPVWQGTPQRNDGSAF